MWNLTLDRVRAYLLILSRYPPRFHGRGFRQSLLAITVCFRSAAHRSIQYAGMHLLPTTAGSLEYPLTDLLLLIKAFINL